MHIVYFILLESFVSALMINRTLCSRSTIIWHLPVFMLVKTALCYAAVVLNGPHLITGLCIALSLLYSLIFFSDGIARKLTVVAACALCIGISNIFKFSYLARYGIPQELKLSEDILGSTVCIAFSLLIFTVLTIVATNIICRVRWKIVAIITGVMLLVLTFSTAVYRFMHSLVDAWLGSVFAIYAMIYLLPAIVLLYFSEAVIFSHRESFFKT